MMLAARGAARSLFSRRVGLRRNGNDMDNYAGDVAALAEALDLKSVIHVGHSTGGAGVARYRVRARWERRRKYTGWPDSTVTGARHKALRERSEKRSCSVEIGGREAFCEPTVNGSQELSPLGGPPPAVPQPGEAGGTAQLPGQRALLA